MIQQNQCRLPGAKGPRGQAMFTECLHCARHGDKDTMVSNTDKDSDLMGLIITKCTSTTSQKQKHLWELESGMSYLRKVFELSTQE